VDIRSLRPTVVEVSLGPPRENFRAVQAAVAVTVNRVTKYGRLVDPDTRLLVYYEQAA
jgi:hypothetical protein